METIIIIGIVCFVVTGFFLYKGNQFRRKSAALDLVITFQSNIRNCIVDSVSKQYFKSQLHILNLNLDVDTEQLQEAITLFNETFKGIPDANRT